MAITLPQYVKFHNARLQVCSWCLQVVCAVMVVFQFIHFGKYGKLIQLEGSVQLVPDYRHTVAQMLKDGRPHNVCDRPMALDPWLDAKGNRYGNHTCIPICVRGYSKPCVKHREAVFSESANTVFVATQIQNQSGLNDTVQNYFMTSAEAVAIHLLIDYRWPHVSWYSADSFLPQWEWHSSSKDAHVHLVNKDNHEVRSFAPGSAIMLSVSEMMHLAGVGSLDTVEPLAGSNYMPGAHAVQVAGPTRRLNGMQLDVQVNCGSEGDKYKCVLQIVAEPGTWVSDSTFCNLFTGGDAYRTCRGIRIKSIFGGVRRLLDFNALFINIFPAWFFSNCLR